MTRDYHVQGIGLRPERAEEYLRLHAEPWPEVIAALWQAGLRDYTIHHHAGANLLVQRFRVEGPDPAASLRWLSEGESMRAWRELTAGCQAPFAGHASWAPMREVFRLE